MEGRMSASRLPGVAASHANSPTFSSLGVASICTVPRALTHLDCVTQLWDVVSLPFFLFFFLSCSSFLRARSGEPAPPAEGAAPLRAGSQADPGPVPVPARAPPAQHHPGLLSGLLRAADGAARDGQQEAQPRQVGTEWLSRTFRQRVAISQY